MFRYEVNSLFTEDQQARAYFHHSIAPLVNQCWCQFYCA